MTIFICFIQLITSAQTVPSRRGTRKFTVKVAATGAPAEVVVTPSKTTLNANDKDISVINISVMDSLSNNVPDATNLIKISITGNARILGIVNGDPSSREADHCEEKKCERSLSNGKCQLIIQAGKEEGIIKVYASSNRLYKGETEIHLIYPGIPHNVLDFKDQGLKAVKHKDKVLGADISFLPELENKGVTFFDEGHKGDAIEILKRHGINYIRLRLFNNPAADSGYSPKRGFCDLKHTLEMARGVKAAGMKLLLDFHYSDYWADPGKQNKPAAWKYLNAVQLNKALYDYTSKCLKALKNQGIIPDMEQIGNEINHGMVWPDGHISKMDSLSELLNSGIKAVRSVTPSTLIMIHIALGGQNDEAVFFLDNIFIRGVKFDVIGLSYYPKWHGTLEDLQLYMKDLSKRYQQDLIVVEYSQKKKEVNDIVFRLPHQKGLGSFIWEHLNTWESVFDNKGKSNDWLKVYDQIAKEYLNTDIQTIH